jgi:DNA-binding NarL/FixJ family response regulator
MFYLIVTAEDKNMLNTNINNYNDRERKVLELYDDGKNTRDIAKELRMSLRDIRHSHYFLVRFRYRLSPLSLL